MDPASTEVTSRVCCLNSEASIAEAARVMNDHQIGDVVIAENRDGHQVPIGIITDRDIALAVSNSASQPEHLRIIDFMTKTLATCRQEDDLFERVRVMKEFGVTRLPVLDTSGSVVEVTTAHQILKKLTQALQDIVEISQRQRANEMTNRH